MLDIASGPGRYVLETIHKLGDIPIAAVLRDYKAENLEAGRRLTDELGLNAVTIVHGDAFDRDSLAAVTAAAHDRHVSGLYELFPTTSRSCVRLRGLADAVEAGGHLIYTNQPWHPQVEFIAGVLINREGEPWIVAAFAGRNGQAGVCRRRGSPSFPRRSTLGHLHGVAGPCASAADGPSGRTSLLLSSLFVTVYASTNWITDQHDVKTWWFEWELAIPFVPALIFPYMSLDLLLRRAFFVPRRTGAGESWRGGGLSILAAGVFFLMLPLSLVFQRPRAEGSLDSRRCVVQSALPDVSTATDFPSLHITLRRQSVVRSLRAAHIHILRVISHTWFSLIGFSTVLTYQHQASWTSPGGFLLAGSRNLLYHEWGSRLPVVARPGWVATTPPRPPSSCQASAWQQSVWPWGTFLLWPAGALGIAAAGCGRAGAGHLTAKKDRPVYCCRRCKVGLVFAPVLFGQRLCTPLLPKAVPRTWDEVVPGGVRSGTCSARPRRRLPLREPE